MRSVDSATVAHLQARAGVVVRELLWLTVKDRATGAPVDIGIWADLDTLDLPVISGETGATVTRTYIAAGALLSIDPIPLVADLSVRSVNVSLSGVSPEIDAAIRGYDARFAPAEIHRALFDPATRTLVAPPPCHFVGVVNTLAIPTPAAGGEAVITAELVSATRELTRTNPAKRSDETQRLRADDRFRRYTSTSGMIDLNWGQKS